MPATISDSPSADVPIKESNVDVLIIGAGPAGSVKKVSRLLTISLIKYRYMAAIWFAKLGVNARIIDKRDKKIFTGQADGLQPRALEVFNSFGFVDRPLKEASVGFGINHP